MKTVLVLPFFILVAVSSYGQSTLKGRVSDRDSKRPVFGVNILLKSAADSTILAFVVSDEEGRFGISYSSKEERFFLDLKSMTIKPYRQVVFAGETNLEILLESATLQLEEQVVQAIRNPVVQKKDTLSYSVAGFSTSADRMIGDIIKRLPGIEVLDNGMIRYEGRPLQKFYVEGLDLLEGRYNLATNNLPVGAVESVEILENHQPIRVLDSLVFSDRASLNIRLKQKNVWIGNASAGLGGSPTVWDGAVTPMVFKQNFQSLMSFKTNNFGRNLADELQVLTIEDLEQRGLPKLDNFWLGIPRQLNGAIPEDRTFFNQSLLGSTSFLHKNSKDTEFRFSANYDRLDQSELSSLSQTFFIEGLDSIQFTEENKLGVLQNKLETEFTLTKNRSSNYLKNKLTLDLVHHEEAAETIFNDSLVDQRARLPHLSLTNHLNLLQPLGDKLLEFNSILEYAQSDQNLRVLSIPTIGSPIQERNLLQGLNDQSFFAQNSLGFKKSMSPRWLWTPQVGILYQGNSLKSDLSEVPKDSQPSASAPRMNDVSFSKLTPYVSTSFSYTSETINLKVSLPVNYSVIYARQRTSSPDQEELKRFYMEPALNFKYQLSGKIYFRASYLRSFVFGSEQDYFPSAILTNYRTLEIRSSEIPEERRDAVQAAINYKTPLSAVFVNGGVALRSFNRNVLLANSIASTGQSIISAENISNSGYRMNYFLHASKYVTDWRTTINLQANHQQQEADQLVNAELGAYKMATSSIQVTVFFKPKKVLGLNLLTRFSATESSQRNRTLAQISQWQHSMSVDLFPASNHLVSLSLQSFSNRVQATSQLQSVSFIDVNYRVKLKEKPISFSLIGQNLSNQKEFSTFLGNEFIFRELSLPLRPRQVLLQVEVSF